MSLSLAIYPLFGFNNTPQFVEKRSGYFLGMNRLDFEDEWKVFRQIRDMTSFGDKEPKFQIIVNPKPLPANHKLAIYGDEGIEKTEEDENGETLTYLEAGEFAKIIMSEYSSVINKAIILFLLSLPKDTMVILYWR